LERRFDRVDGVVGDVGDDRRCCTGDNVLLAARGVGGDEVGCCGDGVVLAAAVGGADGVGGSGVDEPRISCRLGVGFGVVTDAALWR